MKVLILVAMANILAGCGQCSRSIAAFKGHDVMCVDGVKYVQFTSGVTVKYDKSGKIELCY